jgi:cyclase
MRRARTSSSTWIASPACIAGTADIRDVLRAGADKVCINTAVVKNPEFIKDASKKFGSSTILIAIEAIRQPDGKYLAYTDNGREYTGLEVLEWAKQVEELGAGEIMITSIDNEGTGLGYDVHLTKMIADAVSVPVIACGGAGRVEDVAEVIVEGGADAVAIASILHYGFIKNNRTTIDTDGEGNTEFLRKRKGLSRIGSAGLHEIKEHLREVNINCRQT